MNDTTERPPLTDEECAGIRARLAAATEGPWTAGLVPTEYDYDPAWSVDAQDGEPVSHAYDEADAVLIARAPTDLAALLADVKRLERWKAEASEVMLGLQDLGKALGLPLGEQTTGPKAVEKAQALVAENQRLRDTIQAVEAVRIGLLSRVDAALESDDQAVLRYGSTLYGVHDELATALGVSGE